MDGQKCGENGSPADEPGLENHGSCRGPLLTRVEVDSSPRRAEPALADLFRVLRDEVPKAPDASDGVGAPGAELAPATVPPPELARESSERSASRRSPVRFVHSVIAGSAKFVVLFLLAWGLLFNFSEVRGSSMEPGIHDRDRILIDHFSLLFSEVSRGDIVVMRYPLDPSLDYIKRIVGLPGDQITIAGGRLWVNDTLVEEPYVDASSVDFYTHMETVVRDDHYFVLGDNRLRSSDSREFGQVHQDLLRGKARVRLWPLDRAGLVQ